MLHGEYQTGLGLWSCWSSPPSHPHPQAFAGMRWGWESLTAVTHVIMGWIERPRGGGGLGKGAPRAAWLSPRYVCPRRAPRAREVSERRYIHHPVTTGKGVHKKGLHWPPALGAPRPRGGGVWKRGSNPPPPGAFQFSPSHVRSHPGFLDVGLRWNSLRQAKLQPGVFLAVATLLTIADEPGWPCDCSRSRLSYFVPHSKRCSRTLLCSVCGHYGLWSRR